MKIVCPEHNGVIRLPENYIDAHSVALNTVVECPICDDEVLIHGVFDFDKEGIGHPVNISMN